MEIEKSMSRQGSLLLAIAEARERERQSATKGSHQEVSPTVKAARDAAYREHLENQKRLEELKSGKAAQAHYTNPKLVKAEDLKKELEKDLVPIENSIRHCRRLFDDYKAEQKEALERRDSEEEGVNRGRLQGSPGALEGEYTSGSRKKLVPARALGNNASGSGLMRAGAASSAAALDNQRARGAPGSKDEAAPQGYASLSKSREHDQHIHQLEMKAKIAAADYQQRQQSIKKN